MTNINANSKQSYASAKTQYLNVLTNLPDCWAASSCSSRLVLLLYSSFNNGFPLLFKFTVQLLLLITRIQ